MSRFKRKWLDIALSLVFFLVLLTVSLPFLVETFVLPPLLDRAGMEGYRVSLSRLGLYGCTVHISGAGQSPPLFAGTFRFIWTPAGLVEGRIAEISANGLQINPAARLPHRNKDVPGKSVPDKTSLPLLVEHVIISNGSLVLTAGKQTRVLPFAVSGRLLDASSRSPSTDSLPFEVRFQAGENVVNGSFTLDLVRRNLSVTLDGDFDLPALAAVIPYFPTALAGLEGNVQLALQGEIGLAPIALGAIQTSLVIDRLHIAINEMDFATLETVPARVSVTGSGSRFRVQGSGFRMESPLAAGMDFDTRLSFVGGKMAWEGQMGLAPAGEIIPGGNLVLRNTGPFQLHHRGSVYGGRAEATVTMGQTDENTGEVSIALNRDRVSAAVAKLSLFTRITYDGETWPERLNGKLTLEGKEAKAAMPQGTLEIPGFSLTAEGAYPAVSSSPGITVRLNVDGASAVMAEQPLKLQDIHLDLPVAWPTDETVRKGSLEMNTFLYNGKDMGSVRAKLVQQADSLQLEGFLQTPLLPKKKIPLAGTIRQPREKAGIAELAFSLTDGQVDTENLVPFFPALQGMTGSGVLDARGVVRFSPCGLSGEANLAFHDGRVHLTEGEMELNGIELRLSLPSLPALHTPPEQYLAVSSVRKKKLAVSDLKAWFEIESPSSLSVEQISARWSDGRIFSGFFRLQREQEELSFALFCDRLKLSSILSQFGLAQAGGEGRLSGRVPLVYRKGEFFIDDGFLFSTPGEKGTLRISQSKYLETTIPANVPQFSPLHFAGAALADFEYNWAKLRLTSEGDNLLLQLQVDGKPKEKLPFRFDTANNVFVRLDDESSGGIDQPIQLDVNFNLPVNEMFQYREKLMPLFKKFNQSGR